MAWDRFSELADAIEGWLSKSEGAALRTWASQCTGGDVVEIGSWQGKSTVQLGAGVKDQGITAWSAERPRRVWAIDPGMGSDVHAATGPHWNYPKLLSHLAAVGLLGDPCIPIPLTSEQAAKGWPFPVGMLWIDGDHSVSAVAKDVECWWPLLISGGRVAFHDVGFDGPAQAIARLKSEGRVEKMAEVENIWSAVKKA